MKVILIFATSALLLCQAHGQVQRSSQGYYSGTARQPVSYWTSGQSVNDASDNGIFLSDATPSVGNSPPSPINGAVAGTHSGTAGRPVSYWTSGQSVNDARDNGIFLSGATPAGGHSGFGPFSPFFSGVGSPLYGAAFNPLYGGAALAHTLYGRPLSSVPGLVNPVFPGLVPTSGLLPYSNGLGFPGATVGLNPLSLLSKSYGATYGLPPFSSPLGLNPFSGFALKSSPLNAFSSTYGLHTSPFGLSSAYTGLGLHSPFAGLNSFSYGPRF